MYVPLGLCVAQLVFHYLSQVDGCLYMQKQINSRVRLWECCSLVKYICKYILATWLQPHPAQFDNQNTVYHAIWTIAGGCQQPAFHCVSVAHTKPASHSVDWSGRRCHHFKHFRALGSCQEQTEVQHRAAYGLNICYSKLIAVQK